MQKTFEKNYAGLLLDTVMANQSDEQLREGETETGRWLNRPPYREVKGRKPKSRLIKGDLKLQHYADITELNRTIVTNLIKSIHISEPTKVDGEIQYEIEIRYKFQNAFDAKKENPPASEFSDGLGVDVR